MTRYPAWKTVLLVVVTLIGTIYALPNLYGDVPAVQIVTVSGKPLQANFGNRVRKVLTAEHIEYHSSHLENKQWVIRFRSENQQLKAASALKRALNPSGQPPIYTVALNLVSRTPNWLRAIGAHPMALGLDLRGGVHFLLQVDTKDAKRNALKRYLTDFSSLLRNRNIHYESRRVKGDALVFTFPDRKALASARNAIRSHHGQLETTVSAGGSNENSLNIRLNPTQAKKIVDSAVEQNLVTIRNRVNALGVSDSVVQRQGENHIVVELPGVQDPTRVKELLGATATLEYRPVDQDHDPEEAARTGIVPPGDELFYTRQDRRPVLLKQNVIASGSDLVSAAATYDQNGNPSVSVTLDAAAAKRMLHFTERNVGKPMAVLYKESQVETRYNKKGQPIRTRKEISQVISVATVQGVFGKRFQTTGLTSKEAHDLSLLLKAGALAAPVDIVAERTIGPSLGAQNIHEGAISVIVAFALVICFMALYYRVFGLFADFALLLNLILIVGGLSIMHATLTMPGIAGIVLTLGMAVDANVLINERTREELRAGMTPFAALQAGYERAFITIADSNVTTLIAAVVLFALGSGAVKGFAVTLSLGIVTSMFTAIVGTRTLAYYTFRGRKLKDLPV